MKAIVLFYSYKSMTNEGMPVELNHYKFFLNKKDCAKFLTEQNESFTPLAIQRIDVSKSMIVENKFAKISLKKVEAKEGKHD